ncbi:MAG: MoaD/ThiS family protein [Candidatus Woesearchaeota archaeon]
MELFIEKSGNREKIKFTGSVGELLSRLKINPETVIIVKNDAVVTEDEKLNDDDVVKILSVVSGG